MLVNVTPHVVRIITEDGSIIEIETSGKVARVAQAPAHQVGDVDGVPIYMAGEFGEITDLPGPEPGIVFIASMLIAQRAATMGRTDVVSPGTGPQDGAIRRDGQVWAVSRLIRW